MPIQRVADIDLQSEQVCRFLNRGDESYDDFRNTEFVFEFDQAAYEEIPPAIDLPAHETVPDNTQEICLYSAVQVSVEVRDRATDAHQDFGIMIEHVAHPMILGSSAHLFLDRTLQGNRRDQIVQAFTSFVVGRDDIEDLETTLVTGGRSSDYYIVLSWTLTRRGPPVRDVSQEDTMRRSIPEQWKLVLSAGEPCCDAPDLDYGEIVVVRDADHPEPELGQKAAQDHRVKECLDLVTTAHRVGTLLTYPETKTEWEMKTIRIGRCRLGKTRLPQVYRRTSKKALYAYIISPQTAVNHYKKTFENAIEDALKLLPSLVWMVVKGDLSGAKSAFKEFANDLLDKTIPDDVRKCVIPELDIVTEHGDWEKWP
jgi:hypothetical protein